MTTTRKKIPDKSGGRSKLILAINSPLGFFVLALLIVESFLGIVLTYANIESQYKNTFIWIGCILFLFVTSIVSLLVWFKPENLTFDKEAHLVDKGKMTFGTDQQTIKPEKRFANQTTQE
jgi:hypothetical protein